MPTPQFLAEPTIEPGPVHAPLVAWPRVSASGADQIRVRIEQNGDAGTNTSWPRKAAACCLGSILKALRRQLCRSQGWTVP